MNSKYHINNQDHRIFTGSDCPEVWDTIGRLQFDLCIEHGLHHHMKFIDIGCGSLRGGVHFIRHIGANYFGIDKHREMIDAGLDIELPAVGLHSSYDNFDVNSNFDISKFNVKFDMGIAQSVFTHLPLYKLIECLDQIHPHFNIGGKFIVTLYVNNSKQQTMEYDINYRLKPVFEGNPIDVDKHSIRPVNNDDPENDSGMKSFIFQRHTVQSITPHIQDKWQMKALGGWKAHPRWPTLYVFKKVL